LKVIVVGLGNDYRKYKTAINKKYDVIAVSDSFYSSFENVYDGIAYIPLSDLSLGG